MNPFRIAACSILAVTIILASLFFATREAWYDQLHIEQQVEFWNEGLVAYGTLALAIMTFASVVETHMVLADEDLRFRRGRMPVVRLNWVRPSDDVLCEVQLCNIGDGAARNVRLSLDSTVEIHWNQAGTADNRTECVKRKYQVRGDILSFLQRNEEMSLFFRPEGESERVFAVNPGYIFRIDRAVLLYQDMFGDQYRTRYITPLNVANLSRERFEWDPPETLVPRWVSIIRRTRKRVRAVKARSETKTDTTTRALGPDKAVVGSDERPAP